MKCEIIRDLMPLYLDGLSSEESNRAVQEHLRECELCNGVLEQMKRETEVEAEVTKKRINPFRKFNLKMKAYIAATLAVCVAFGGLAWKGFVKGFAIEPDKVAMDVCVDKDMLYLDFALDNGNIMHYATMYDSTMASIALRRVWNLPADDLGIHPNRFRWGMDLDVLKLDTGESTNIIMKDGNLETVKEETVDSVMVQNGEGGPVSILLFREGEEAVSATSVLVDEEMQEYTVEIDYGNETVSYTMAELLEMAKK